MRTSEFKEIQQRLAPHFPEFAIRGKMMFLTPVESVLRGFHFETSGFTRGVFYLWAYFLPLFVPTKNVHFTLGHRLGKGHRWRTGEPDLEALLLPEIKTEVARLLRLQDAQAIASALEPL